MRFGLLPDWLNASPLQLAVSLSILGCAFAAGGTTVSAQIKVISADNLTPFLPRDVGTTSDAKTVRIKLNYPRAISSIAIAPGNEFAAGAVSGCVVDGHTVNPGLSVCIVDVTFTPQYAGLRTAPLVLTDGEGTKSSVGLEGTGLASRAALTPGIITTIAGNGTKGYSGDGGPATAAEFNGANDLKLDWAGNLYIAEEFNHVARKVDRNGIITTVAGNGFLSYSSCINPATSASLGELDGVAIDPAGNLYIANGWPLVCVLKVDLNGIVTRFAGTGARGYSGDGGPATQAELGSFSGLAADAAGNIYIADGGNSRIRKVDTQGIISTVAGNGNFGYSGDGGPATQATLSLNASGLAFDAAGDLYIADTINQRIRKVDTNGIIHTIAGNGHIGFSGDGGPATQAELYYPYGIAVDAAGNIYIGDSGNERIRRVDTNGTIKTIAGTGDSNYSGDGGPATKAGLVPGSLAIDSSGALLLLDFPNNRVRKVDVSKSAVNFASQTVGTVTPSQQVTVTNIGNQHIELTDLTLSGDFGQLTGTSRDCTDTTFLGVGFSCALRITFTPTAAGTLTGFATVTDNSLSLPGTKQTISLSGYGTNP